jgi:hypothetical protein
MEPTLPSDTPEMDLKFMRQLTRYIGLVPKVAINAMDLYKVGQLVIIKNTKSQYYYSRGEILSITPDKAKIFLIDITKTITISMDDISVPNGILQRIRREKRREKEVQRLSKSVWFGMPVKNQWKNKKSFEKLIFKKEKKYFTKKMKFQEEQKEKLEMATRQADRDQKTVQEYLTKDQYKNLTKPFVDSLTEYEQKNQPKYLSPYKVVSWTKQCKSFL